MGRFIAIVAIIITSPIMIITAIAIKLTSPGPIIFKQERIGFHGKPFKMYKFRSMYVNSPDLRNEDGSTYNGENDPRVTKIGKILRKTSLDEIPQFLNILKGDMSLVGPRPERVEHTELYSKEVPEFQYRLKVKGGLTGFASSRSSLQRILPFSSLNLPAINLSCS